jgi:hypothetical protein
VRRARGEEPGRVLGARGPSPCHQVDSASWAAVDDDLHDVAVPQARSTAGSASGLTCPTQAPVETPENRVSVSTVTDRPTAGT